MINQETGRMALPGVLLFLCFSMTACGGGGTNEPANNGAQPATAAIGASPGVVATVNVTPVVAAELAQFSGQESAQGPATVVLQGVELLTPATLAETSCGLNGSQGIKAELLQAVNAVRAAGAVCGTSIYRATHDLNWNNMLQRSAADHSRDMARNHFFSHLGSDGGTLLQRIQATGYGLSAAGENIAAGQGNVKEVIASWLNSPGHCRNMLDPSYVDVGVACVRNDNAPYGFYWTMNLGRH